MDKNKLLLKKQYGDINTVAQILSLNGRYTSPANVRMLLERENAKRHHEAIEALRQVIESREKLLVKD